MRYGDPRYNSRYRSEWPTAYRRGSTAELVLTVALACGHTTDFPEPAPRAGQPAYCRRCASCTRVTEGAHDA